MSKAAYMHRHNLAPRARPDQTLDKPSQPKVTRARSPRTHGEKSWQQKRKEHLLSRTGGWQPSEADVAATAIQFVSKLKVKARRASGDAGVQSEAEQVMSPDRPPASSMAGSRVPKEKTWQQKRKEHYIARAALHPLEHNEYTAEDEHGGQKDEVRAEEPGKEQNWPIPTAGQSDTMNEQPQRPAERPAWLQDHETSQNLLDSPVKNVLQHHKHPTRGLEARQRRKKKRAQG